MSEESLGKKIRLARQKRKWSQETLAEKLGVAPRTVLRWEIKDELPNNENQQGLIDLLSLKEEDFQRQQIVEEQKQETPVIPIPVSELEQMLPSKEDFKVYSGRRIYRKDGKYMSKTTYVTVNGSPLKYFGFERLNPEKVTVFEWGYYGTGPESLAKAILADYLGETYPEKGFAFSSEFNTPLFASLFKDDIIAKLPRTHNSTKDDSWQITSDQIRKWFYLLEEEGITRTVLLKNIYGENSD